MWVVYEYEAERKSGEEVTILSVEPDFGPKHTCSLDCWCHPALDEESDCILIHNCIN